MVRRPLVRTSLLAGLGWLASASPVVAAPPPELPEGQKSSQLREIEHRVDVELGKRSVRCTVHRTLRNTGTGAAEVQLRIPDPVGAGFVASGLRMRADDGKWYAGKIHPVDEAHEIYEELTGSDKEISKARRKRARDPVLLSWADDGYELFVYPVNPKHDKRVRYDLEALYSYRDGAAEVVLPASANGELPPTFEIKSIPENHELLLGTRTISVGATLSADEVEKTTLRLVALEQRPVKPLLSSVRLGRRHFARLDLAVTADLGPNPTGTHVVILLDSSRSMTAGSAEAARSAALDYLASLDDVPDTKARVVSFHRTLTPVVDQFVSADEARRRLADFEPSLGNGSDLPAALAEAREALEDVPQGRPQRILILTDTFVSRADAKKVVKILERSKAVVHVADVTQATGTSLSEDGAHPWSKAAARSGGLVWRATVDPHSDIKGAPFVSWVRPTKLRNIEVRLDGKHFEGFFPSIIDAGQAWDFTGWLDGAPKKLSVEASVWGSPLDLSVRRKKDANRQWARLAVVELDEEATDEEVLDLAMRTNVVSPMTAALALEPNVQPGTIDYDNAGWRQANRRAVRVRTVGCGFGFGSPHLGRYHLNFDEKKFLEDAVRDARHQCDADWRQAHVDFDLSYAEILNLGRVELASLESGDAKANEADEKIRAGAEACVREALWRVEVPAGMMALRTQRIDLDPAGRVTW